MHRALLGFVGLTAAAAAFGQDVDRRVELREFALPSASVYPAVSQMSQIGEAAPEVAIDDPNPTDRTIAIPQARPAAGVAIAQVPRPDVPAPTAQITQDGEGRRIDPDALSSPEQSAPGSVTRLGGTDRCDPQADQAGYRACLRILERRADEFTAPSAPKLSAEEVLLAQRQADDEVSATLTIDQRIRRASKAEPDADLTSNQELASLILSSPGQQPIDPIEDDSAERAAEIDAVLKAIGLPVQPQL